MQAKEQTETMDSKVESLGELLEYQDNSIVSRVLLKNNAIQVLNTKGRNKILYITCTNVLARILLRQSRCELRNSARRIARYTWVVVLDRGPLETSGSAGFAPTAGASEHR